jgi:hypothetical protein
VPTKVPTFPVPEKSRAFVPTPSRSGRYSLQPAGNRAAIRRARRAEGLGRYPGMSPPCQPMVATVAWAKSEMPVVAPHVTVTRAFFAPRGGS